MNIQAKKLHIIEWLIRLQDEGVVNRIYSFRKKITSVANKRMTIDELYAELDASEDARKSGKITTLEKLEKESESW